MSEHKIGEQWVEEIDGVKHMVKAVNSTYNCNGCAYLCDNGKCSHESIIECPIYMIDAIIKDLGILNKDGCLPNCWGSYPLIEENKLYGLPRHFRCLSRDGVYCTTNAYPTKQQAIDAWNRRA